MSIIRSCIVCLVASASGWATAADPGPWSVAVDYGDTTLDGESGTDFGLPYRTGDSTQGMRVAVARDVWGPFSVELAHDEMGELTEQYVTVFYSGLFPFDPWLCPSPSCSVGGGLATHEASADSLALRARFAPMVSLSLGVEVGIARIEYATLDAQDVPLWGASAGYRLGDAWSVELRWSTATIERASLAQDDLTTLRLGVRYGF